MIKNALVGERKVKASFGSRFNEQYTNKVIFGIPAIYDDCLYL